MTLGLLTDVIRKLSTRAGSAGRETWLDLKMRPLPVVQMLNDVTLTGRASRIASLRTQQMMRVEG